MIRARKSLTASVSLKDVCRQRRGALLRFFALRTGCFTTAEAIVREIEDALDTLAPAAAEKISDPAAFLYRLGSDFLIARERADLEGRVLEDEWRLRRSDKAAALGRDEAAAKALLAGAAAYRRGRLDRIVRAMADLSADARRAFGLRRLDGLSQAETARVMGQPSVRIERHVGQALSRLLEKVGWP